jgi:hypothetical protein
MSDPDFGQLERDRDLPPDELYPTYEDDNSEDENDDEP